MMSEKFRTFLANHSTEVILILAIKTSFNMSCNKQIEKGEINCLKMQSLHNSIIC